MTAISTQTETKPMLLFFYSPTSGQSRRAEGFLAQVLQRRRNHETFTLRHVDSESRPDLAARFGVTQLPALVVVENKRVCGKAERPNGCAEIRTLLAPWLK
jgi:thioredoxin-like negative regulator of GroEL